LEANKIKLVLFCICANGFQIFFQPRKREKFLLASLETLTNSKDCSESRVKGLFQHSFSLDGQLSEQFSGSAFKTTFRVTGGIGKPEEGYYSRRIFTINKLFFYSNK
jgi:hypothetical protein